jgi:hypothetical protein
LSKLSQIPGLLWKLQIFPPTAFFRVIAAGKLVGSSKRYWLVTTPDGVKYRFGGEVETETGADQNSGLSVPLA